MNFTAKPLINNLDDNQLIRIFLEFVYKNNIPYEKNTKEISYKCHEATWIIPAGKAMGYGRTQSQAYQQALRNLFDFLLEAENSQRSDQKAKKGVLSLPMFQVKLSTVIKESCSVKNIQQRLTIGSVNSNLKNNYSHSHSTSKFSSNKSGITVLTKNTGSSKSKILKKDNNNSSSTSLAKNFKAKITSHYENLHIKTQYNEQEIHKTDQGLYEEYDKSLTKNDSKSQSQSKISNKEMISQKNLQEKSYFKLYALNKSKSKKSQLGFHHQSNLSNLSSHTNASNHSSYSNQYTQMQTTQKDNNSTKNQNAQQKQHHFIANPLNANLNTNVLRSIKDLHNIGKSNQNRTIGNTGKDKQKRDIYYSKIILNKSTHSEALKSESQIQKSQSEYERDRSNKKVKTQLKNAKQKLQKLVKQLCSIVQSNQVLKANLKEFQDPKNFQKVQEGHDYDCYMNQDYTQSGDIDKSMNISFNENPQKQTQTSCLNIVKHPYKNQKNQIQDKQEQITYHSDYNSSCNGIPFQNNNKSTNSKATKEDCPYFSSYKNSNIKEQPQDKSNKIDIENFSLSINVSLANNQKSSQLAEKIKNPMKNSILSVSKCQVPKLKLDILPNYHKKNQKSLNETLLANYNQKHGKSETEIDYDQSKSFDKIMI